MNNRLTSLLGIDIPIIQAPMAGVSTPALAAAVSNAGALGSLGLGGGSAETAFRAMSELKSLTNKPWHVNFFAHKTPEQNLEREQAWLEALSPQFAEAGGSTPSSLSAGYVSFLDDPSQLAAVVEARAPVVSFHFGLPNKDHINELKNYGAHVLASATSVQEAIACEAAGVDAIIAQGVEAGGHRGAHDEEAADDRLGTFALLPQIVDAVSVPVIAAGGVTDARGILAAFALGAEGVQMGTAFVACEESAASPAHKACLTQDIAPRTIMTRGVSGRTARGIANRLLETVETLEAEAPDYPIAYDAAKALSGTAKKNGVNGFEVMWAGQAAGLARPMRATSLIEALNAEMQTGLLELTSLLIEKDAV